MVVVLLAVCAGCTTPAPRPVDHVPATTATTAPPAPVSAANSSTTPSTFVPPYAHTGSRDLSPVAQSARPLVYVPNQLSGTVQVIDPRTYRVVETVVVARSPEHIVPSHDLRTLWVNSDAGNALTPIDPHTGRFGPSVSVADPYNLYFTPDGSEALVMAERLRRIDVLDPRTMGLRRSLDIPCAGLNHADYTADLKLLVISCEFSGQLVVVDADATRIIRILDLNRIATPGATPPAMARSMGGPKANLSSGASAMPQDVRLSPDGRWILVADMLRNGIWVMNARTMSYDRFIHTGAGAHAIYPSRDASRLYVSNRDDGTISVLDGTSLRATARWTIPGGGSPDMGGVTADGREFWLSGRYNSVVYVFDTSTGQLTHTVPVLPGPHGLLVWPQPGRFSLGHTGNMR